MHAFSLLPRCVVFLSPLLLLMASPVFGEASVDWRFKGELSLDTTHVWNSYATFDERGTDGTATSIQQMPAIVAQFFPRASADPAKHQLASGAKVNLQLSVLEEDIWSSAKVVATSRAGYLDSLTVLGSEDLPSGYVEFGWDVSGTLDFTSVGSPALSLGYDVGYELYANSTAARYSASKDFIFDGIAPGGPVNQSGSVEYLEPQPWPTTVPPNFSRSETFDLDGQSARVLVPFQPGQPIAVGFFLVTWANITAIAVDPGNVVIDGDASFHNTSRLTSLTVLDDLGQPVTVPYTIESANGYLYPSPIPEPGTLPLLVAGGALLPVLRRWRRLSQSGAGPR